jgi:hypothetical protein
MTLRYGDRAGGLDRRHANGSRPGRDGPPRKYAAAPASHSNQYAIPTAGPGSGPAFGAGRGRPLGGPGRGPGPMGGGGGEAGRMPYSQSQQSQGRGVLRTLTRPTLHVLLLLRGSYEDEQSTDVESPAPPPLVCMRIQSEGRSCSDIGLSACSQ